ncbi:MAG: tryptophan 2,3-dioxygenase [Bacteriovoracaceae bacterium]|nr:tryptophan 2,3-dioxygenase [Bacteriovoracaceae bacterium]
MKHEPIYYGSYLELDKLLDAQNPMSKKNGKEAHDETLFIIIHQAYELWFKQIIHEIDSIYDIFSNKTIAPEQISLVNHRLARVNEIQRVLNAQMKIIETMTPMDFMDFRDYLIPASGFQSIQFRTIELKLGLREKQRTTMAKKFFNSRLSEEDKEYLKSLENSPTLLELVDKWLSRMPFTETDNFDFWKSYKDAVEKMLTADKDLIKKNTTLNEMQQMIELKNLEATKESFDILFDKEKYNSLLENDDLKLSQKAKLSAIFISLYRHEPVFQLPYRLINHLIEIDELFTQWRYNHAIMVHRMLGTKIGTGGSSGHDYLKKAADNNKIFSDFFDMATFLIPNAYLPKLPENLKVNLGFMHE